MLRDNIPVIQKAFRTLLFRIVQNIGALTHPFYFCQLLSPPVYNHHIIPGVKYHYYLLPFFLSSEVSDSNRFPALEVPCFSQLSYTSLVLVARRRIELLITAVKVRGLIPFLSNGRFASSSSDLSFIILTIILYFIFLSPFFYLSWNSRIRTYGLDVISVLLYRAELYSIVQVSSGRGIRTLDLMVMSHPS